MTELSESLSTMPVGAFRTVKPASAQALPDSVSAGSAPLSDPVVSTASFDPRSVMGAAFVPDRDDRNAPV